MPAIDRRGGQGERGRTGAAEARAGTGEAMAGAAEARAGAADARAGVGKARAGAAEARAGVGKARAGKSEARAGAGRARAGMGDARAGAADARAGVGKARAGTGEARAGVAEAKEYCAKAAELVAIKISTWSRTFCNSCITGASGERGKASCTFSSTFSCTVSGMEGERGMRREPLRWEAIVILESVLRQPDLLTVSLASDPCLCSLYGKRLFGLYTSDQ
jgi:hypothetical protein